MKVYSYAYRITNDTKWADLAYAEIQASANLFFLRRTFLTPLSRTPFQTRLVPTTTPSGIPFTSSTRQR